MYILFVASSLLPPGIESYDTKLGTLDNPGDGMDHVFHKPPRLGIYSTQSFSVFYSFSEADTP